MGFLNKREMADYIKNTCSSSENEEMVDSDIDLDGNFNIYTEMDSKNEHETRDGNKTEYTEYQELPIIKNANYVDKAAELAEHVLVEERITLRDDVNYLQSQSMQKNLIFTSVPEAAGNRIETPKTTEKMLRKRV
ncbi:uncharacterized protein LOC127866039 isoform X5 [Dreissena polymorpha]|uniref:uncharacterized protein LOC127866039 isoform X5 n=1 Tax=Dreissena polymorpha TaxID=45954 RepID=UPI0022642818|nr:uncharacterized protein LOC127866039 isoform X5 [Dreissena polymorpha]